MGTVAKFRYKGNEYSYEGVCRFKIGDSWVDAVMYSKDNHMYVREILDFIVKFECVEAMNPLPGGDIYLKKNKTAADVAGDILGHGYTPGFKDKTQIPAEEVECVDPAQDDGPWYVVEDNKTVKLNNDVSKCA